MVSRRATAVSLPCVDGGTIPRFASGVNATPRDAALVYFQEGLALAEQHNDHASAGAIHRSLGTIAADRKAYATARRHLEIALAEAERVEDRSQAAEIRTALAQLPRPERANFERTGKRRPA